MENFSHRNCWEEAIRERTLVLLAAPTGLRQSELFALKWDDAPKRVQKGHQTVPLLHPRMEGEI